MSHSTQDGIHINSGATGNNVAGNIVSTSTQHGINIGASDNTISDNTVTDSAANGIALNSGVTGTDVSDNTISYSIQNGIYIDSGATGNNVAGNIVSASTQNGIYIYTGATGNSVVGNAVSTSTQNGINVKATNSIITGNTTINNTTYGISVEASNNQVLRNVISNNHGSMNLFLGGAAAPISNLTIQGNKIGTKADGTVDGNYTQGAGILLIGNVTNSLIGGTSPGDGNIIAGNDGAGIGISAMNITGFGTITPTSNTIVGNSIFGNNVGNIYGFAMPGLGIDNYMVNLDGSFVPQSTSETGVTANDSADTDTGPNNYMNFPVLNSATQTGTSLALNYDLDAADSSTNQYRVEFFANDTADPSGNGEGQTYLGSVTATNGTGNTANLTLPSGTNLTGKVLSATTTAIDGSTASGFGSTSEFSLALAATVHSVSPQTSTAGSNNTPSTSTSSNNTLINTGSHLNPLFVIASVILLSVLGLGLLKRRPKVYKTR